MSAHSVTRPFARGAAIGAMILTVFAAVWALSGLMSWPQAPAWTFAIVTLAIGALAVYSVARFVATSRLPREQEDAQAARQWLMAVIWLALILAVQMMFIAVATIILGNSDQASLLPVVVTAIVGVHFLPLALVFRIPIYWGTGLLLLACVAGSLLMADQNVRLLLLGLSVALVLSISAVVVLVRYTR
jgi:hypothetical protein